MRKLILLLLLAASFCAKAQTPVSPIQLTTNSAYLEPSTGLHWNYNGATYLWWAALGLRDSTRYVTPYYLSNNYYNKTQSNGLYQLLTNLATSTSLGTSNTLYPSQNAVKTYVDNVGGSFLQKTNDLSDVANPAKALYNIGGATSPYKTLKKFSPPEVAPGDLTESGYNSFAKIIQFGSGTYALIYRHATSHTASDGVMEMRTSRDGKTWGSPVVIYSEAGISVDNYSAIVTPTGRLIIAFDRNTSSTGTYLNSKYIYSDNEGTAFSSPVLLTGFGVPYGGGIMLDDGKILISGYKVPVNNGAQYILSSDDGATFIVHDLDDGVTTGFNETTYANLSGGDVLAVSRTTTGIGMFQFISHDYALTWAFQGVYVPPSSVSMVSPMLDTYQLPSGRIGVNILYADRTNNKIVINSGSAIDIINNGVAGWTRGFTYIASSATNDFGYPSIVHPNNSEYGLISYYEALTPTHTVQHFATDPPAGAQPIVTGTSRLGSILSLGFAGYNSARPLTSLEFLYPQKADSTYLKLTDTIGAIKIVTPTYANNHYLPIINAVAQVSFTAPGVLINSSGAGFSLPVSVNTTFTNTASVASNVVAAFINTNTTNGYGVSIRGGVGSSTYNTLWQDAAGLTIAKLMGNGYFTLSSLATVNGPPIVPGTQVSVTAGSDGTFSFKAFDTTPAASSLNPVTSDGIFTALATKQATLVSATNIKTVNSNSLLGSGNIAVGDALVANPLSQFAATTSAQLATVLTDENGTSGGFVRGTGATLNSLTTTGTGNFSSLNQTGFFRQSGTNSIASNTPMDIVNVASNGFGPFIQGGSDVAGSGNYNLWVANYLGVNVFKVLGGNVTATGSYTGTGLTLTTAPTTSAGTYDVLTRNTSTGGVEKITSVPVSMGGADSTTYRTVLNSFTKAQDDVRFVKTNNGITLTTQTGGFRLTGSIESQTSVTTPSLFVSGTNVFLSGLATYASGGYKNVVINTLSGRAELVAPGTAVIDATSTSYTMTASTRYVSDNASLVTFTLPATAVVGDIFIITGYGSGLWKIAQNSGQTIHGATDTTTGTGGSVTATGRYNSIQVVCVKANTDFTIQSSQGALTIL